MSWRHEETEIAEMTVLGHMLAVKCPLAAFADVDLHPDDFYHETHAEMYRAMRQQLIEAVRVDPVKLLKATGKAIDLKGGRDYLKTLRSYALGGLKAKQAAVAVKDTARRRAIEEGCQKAAAAASDYSRDIDEAHALLYDALRRTLDTGSGKRPEFVGDLVQGHLDGLLQLQERGGIVGVPTPFPDLDRLTGGFAPGEVIILAGRPGTGKTAFALNVAYYAARRGAPVGVFSMEMPAQQLLNRVYSAVARVDAQKFRNGNFTHADWQSIHSAADQLATMPLYISDRSSIKPLQIKEKCRIWQQEHGLKLVVVDYLQLITPESRGQSREREVADISRALKTTAVDLGIPILLLAQLNRDAEKSSRPLLSHLRESGAVEQDADMVLFLVPWKVNTSDEHPIVELDIAKGRSNACGSVKMTYDKRHLLFGNYFEGEES